MKNWSFYLVDKAPRTLYAAGHIITPVISAPGSIQIISNHARFWVQVGDVLLQHPHTVP